MNATPLSFSASRLHGHQQKCARHLLHFFKRLKNLSLFIFLYAAFLKERDQENFKACCKIKSGSVTSSQLSSLWLVAIYFNIPTQLVDWSKVLLEFEQMLLIGPCLLRHQCQLIYSLVWYALLIMLISDEKVFLS